ncbi:MAG: hypothetical protein ACJA2L_000163, partial [Polaribacter sp.]
ATLKILRRFNSERNLLNAIWTNYLGSLTQSNTTLRNKKTLGHNS